MTPLADLLAPCLDDRSPEPLYHRLYLALRDAILGGRLRHRLPSTRRLAQDLRISRNSVAAAFDLLQAEGYLCARVGAGSFVVDSLPDQPIAPSTWRQETPAPIEPKRLSRLSQLLPVEDFEHLPAAPFNMTAAAFADFPWPLWSRLLARPWRRPAPALILRHDAAGLPTLRKAIAEMLGASRAMSCDAEQILITGGSQQALDIACRLLVDPGDQVMVEDPGFFGTDATIRAAGGSVKPQEVDKDGMKIPDDLTGIRAVVVTPSRNFPLGTILSLPRRLALLQAVASAGGWIVEDDFDAEFRFAGRPLASLFGLDRANQVLYAGTFSRTLFPAVRLGYLVVPESLIGMARAVRQASDGGEGSIVQAALSAFIEAGHYGAHIRRQRLRLAAARQALTTALNERLGDLLEIVPADGGLSLTALFLQPSNDREIAAKLAAAGIAARPLSAFYRGAASKSGLVLNFAGWSEETLTATTMRMASFLRDQEMIHRLNK